MNRIAVTATSVFALALVGAGIALSGGTATDRELRRVECRTITMFTPARHKSAEQLCENYGGIALKDAEPSKDGLIILVRNQPMGGFEGDKAFR